MSVDYWNNYYSRGGGKHKPSAFAKFCLPQMIPPCSVLDIGCGIGADSMFFSAYGIHVIGVDGSTEAIRRCLALWAYTNCSPNISFVCKTLESLITCDMQCDHYYLRFFLHTIPPDMQFKCLQWIGSNIKEDGRLFIEARSDQDPYAVIGGHERYRINSDALFDMIATTGLDILEFQESRGLSVTGSENPILIRLVARKGVCS